MRGYPLIVIVNKISHFICLSYFIIILMGPQFANFSNKSYLMANIIQIDPGGKLILPSDEILSPVEIG